MVTTPGMTVFVECDRAPLLEPCNLQGDSNTSGGYVMIRLLALVFTAALFAFVLVHEASARRGAGVYAGAFGAGSFRGISAGAYHGGPRARGYRGYRAAGWRSGRYWSGGTRWYGYGAGVTPLAGAYYYSSPGYPYASGPYGWTGAVDEETGAAPRGYRGPGTCGTYFYWKDGRCVDAQWWY